MLDEVKGGLIVSCQALSQEPLHGADIMAKMALAAEIGNAAGIRANSAIDVVAIKKVTKLPIIGLVKKDYLDSEIYITPTKLEVMELIESGCEMIAVDGTLRKRPNDEKLVDLVNLIHEHGKLAMADISTYEEAIYAEQIGFDCVSTTLSGYTSYSTQCSGPDIKLIRKLKNKLTIPVIAEGKITSVEDAKKISRIKPHAIVIGSAITRPQLITQRYYEAIIKK
jgi:N-acylglucosamine-6-phosphate 2-epimerase